MASPRASSRKKLLSIDSAEEKGKNSCSSDNYDNIGAVKEEKSSQNTCYFEDDGQKSRTMLLFGEEK
jgi:hypothetical protein